MKSRFNEGDIIRFKGETELYKIVLKEITGQVFARHCFNDARYSIIPGELSREVIEGMVEMVESYNKLKSCPHCGGKVERTAWYEKTDRFECEKCGAVTYWDEKYGDEADAAWNRRTE